MKKQVDEKQVVFWSEKYARRAKAEREAALAKARDLTQHRELYQSYILRAAKYVKKVDYVKTPGRSLLPLPYWTIDEERSGRRKRLTVTTCS